MGDSPSVSALPKRLPTTGKTMAVGQFRRRSNNLSATYSANGTPRACSSSSIYSSSPKLKPFRADSDSDDDEFDKEERIRGPFDDSNALKRDPRRPQPKNASPVSQKRFSRVGTLQDKRVEYTLRSVPASKPPVSPLPPFSDQSETQRNSLTEWYNRALPSLPSSADPIQEVENGISSSFPSSYQPRRARESTVLTDDVDSDSQHLDSPRRLTTPDFSESRSLPPPTIVEGKSVFTVRSVISAPIAFLRRNIPSLEYALGGAHKEGRIARGNESDSVIGFPYDAYKQSGDDTSDEEKGLGIIHEQAKAKAPVSITVSDFSARIPSPVQSDFEYQHHHDNLSTPSVRLIPNPSDMLHPRWADYPNHRSHPAQLLTSPKPRVGFTGLASPRMLNNIGRTTANFTHRFPWHREGFVPLKSNGEGAGVSLHTDGRSKTRVGGDGLGLDGDSIKFGSWTAHKWCLFLSVISIITLGIIGTIASLGLWFKVWPHTPVIYVTENNMLLYVTVASFALTLTGIVGVIGTVLNSRPLLAFYNILLWPSLMTTVVVGYSAYKRRTFNLGGKLNEDWSRSWDDAGRLVVQDVLGCCGFYDTLHNAVDSSTCYVRSPLGGCKGKLVKFQRETLDRFWKAGFSCVGIVLLNIFVGMICSNHVNRLFGKGLMPDQYRLKLQDVHTTAEAVLELYPDSSVPPSPLLIHAQSRNDSLRVRAARQQGQGYHGNVPWAPMIHRNFRNG